MDEQAQVGRSRRALLAGAAGAAAAVAVEALARPVPAVGASAALMTEARNDTSAQTYIVSTQEAETSAVFAAYSAPVKATPRVYALFGQTTSSNGFGVYGYTEGDGVGVEGRSAISTGVVGVSGPDEVTPQGGYGVLGSGTIAGVTGIGGTVGVRGQGRGDSGVGVGGHGSGPSGVGVFAQAYGVALIANGLDEAQGVSAVSQGGPAITGASTKTNTKAPLKTNTGVFGFTDTAAGVGVVGQADAGTGVEAISAKGTALKVSGKVRFNRSGRVFVPKNRDYVDVDLTAKGGITSTSLCFANLAYPRSGVYVRAVRPNYPATGKLRIFLNKVASTTTTTPLSWLVLENA